MCKAKIIIPVCFSVILACSMITSCGKTELEEAPVPTYEIIAPEENIVANFKPSDDSFYYLELDGKTTDISDYIVNTENGNYTFKSTLLTDLLNFKKSEEKSNDTFLSFERDNDTVRFEIGGSNILVNDLNIPCVSKMDFVEDGILAIPLDFVYGLSYQHYQISRNDNSLYFILQTPAEDTERGTFDIEETSPKHP